MKAVYALYADGEAAQQAVDRLRAAGLADRDITILSSRPMDEFEFGRMDRANRLWWIASGGGLAGMAAAVALAWYTQTAWPIDVGGLPTFAWWPFLIIIFELTMLGAILATTIALVVTAGLGWRGARLYDPAVSDGNVLVGVEEPRADVLADLEKALGVAGAEVRRV